MRATNRVVGILSLAMLLFAGCQQLGSLDGLGGLGGLGNEIVGEVQYIDTRGSQIEIRTDAGRTSLVRYDNKTQVIYRQRTYAVANLEPGDYIAARVEQERDGRYSTSSINVRESVQERGSSGATISRLDRVEGRVEHVDPRRGTFELRDSRNRLVVVSVAFNAPRAVADRLNRLRSGDQVRIEGRSVNANRFELENFL